ncbi:MAG: F0F1 ATP synthase subunit C [Verrucomicrobia bacterium]|nr:F0F1 ATP synthase subunit C [Alphaproteobacteria bacterium]MBM3857977.1 F0F1 ATP synthase subunit C [Verrucomicrobiota bacterium]
MDMSAAKMIGAGLAMLALLGVGIGLGLIFSNLITAIARNPSTKDDVMKVGLIGFALTESIALLAFVTALIILAK